MMKSLILIGVCCSFLLALNQVLAANAKRGKVLYQSLGCLGCHGGAEGSKLSDYPSLHKLGESMVASELNKYRTGVRKDPTMQAMSIGLSDADIQDIADYVATWSRKSTSKD